MEGPVGLEPTTLCLKGRCSNLLSYGPSFGCLRKRSGKQQGLLSVICPKKSIRSGVVAFSVMNCIITLMKTNKKLNQSGFAHLSLIIIIVLSVAVVGLAGYRVNEARKANRTESAGTTDGQQPALQADVDKQEELPAEEVSDDQPESGQDSASGGSAPAPTPATSSPQPRKIDFVKGGDSTEGDTVTMTHIMTEAHSGTCSFVFKLNGTVRVQKTTQITSSKSCAISIPKSEFPKSATYNVEVSFKSNDGSVYADLGPYDLTII